MSAHASTPDARPASPAGPTPSPGAAAGAHPGPDAGPLGTGSRAPRTRSLARPRRAAALAAVLAGALVLSACGSGREVGADFAQQAKDWPGVVEVVGGGSADLPGAGSAEATITVAEDAPAEVLKDLAKRSFDFAPNVQGPRHMSTVEIRRGEDIVELGNSLGVAERRIDALLKLSGAPLLGRIDIGTSVARYDLSVVPSATNRCDYPALYDALVALHVPNAEGDGDIDVSLAGTGNSQVLAPETGGRLNQHGVALWKRFCDADGPLVVTELVRDSITFSPGYEDERAEAEEVLRGLDTGSLKVLFEDKSGFGRTWPGATASPQP